MVVVECELACGHRVVRRVPADQVTEADVTALLTLWCSTCAGRFDVVTRRLDVETGTGY